VNIYIHGGVGGDGMPSQYGELPPTNGGDVMAGLGHPSTFQWGSRLGFITAVTLLNGSQPNFARCLAISDLHLT